MSGRRNTTVWEQLAGFSLVARLGLLTATILVAWLAVAQLAWTHGAGSGLIASAAAAGLCWFGAAVALAIASTLVGPTAAPLALGLSILARTMLPLALGVVLYVRIPELAEAGLAYYLLGFYLVALATETVLSLASIERTPARKAS